MTLCFSQGGENLLMTFRYSFRTGCLRFGRFDVTEAQLCIMGIHFISFFLGPQAWHMRILGGVQLWFVIVSFSVCAASLNLVNFAKTVRNGGIGKNGSTVAGKYFIILNHPLTIGIILIVQTFLIFLFTGIFTLIFLIFIFSIFNF